MARWNTEFNWVSSWHPSAFNLSTKARSGSITHDLLRVPVTGEPVDVQVARMLADLRANDPRSRAEKYGIDAT
ncbi:MAG: hypothetical protein JWO79_4433 [Actinomycetia bacterium]|nr:hypothetical protein [Actinomycetes bacterium]